MPSEMERILGAPIGHKGIIPGTVPVEGVEVVYFCDDGRTMLEQFEALASSYRNPRHAQYGGMNERGCRLTLPDDSIFHAIGYHGDIEGWRKDIEEGAAEQKITLAKIDGDKFVISDGRVFELSGCAVKFD
jgi:hypothetical protein